MALSWPPQVHLMPILIYQDVLFCAVLAWLIHGLLLFRDGRAVERTILVGGWSVCLLLVIYAAIGSIIYENIHSPFTYRLWVASDHLRGIRASVVSDFSLRSASIIAKMVLLFVCISEGLWRLLPRLLEKTRLTFYSRWSAAFLLVYVFGAHMWTVTYVRYLPAVANPEFAFAQSLFESAEPILNASVPSQYFRDFIPTTAAVRANTTPALPLPIVPRLALPMAHPPRHILMVVMESVGTRRLELYGAPYHDTPQMIRLARHSLVFDRIYASQPYTSPAMVALFCSVYPRHSWIPVTRSTPNLHVPGLADVLAQRGYRTAFMHFGTLGFDNQGEFLRDHGFQQVFSRASDSWGPTDAELLATATTWMRDNFEYPFLLVIWTLDTHHPYFSADARDYDRHDPSLNRYLNAVHSTDRLIGQLTHALDEMKLSDDTLVVITGDHGEAFGEHGQTVHNFTVYDEEVHVPLLLINQRMFDRDFHAKGIGRQIDLAPTLLALLGYNEPSSWQGSSLLDTSSVKRAYLFSGDADFIFGLVDGRFKYIFNSYRSRPELYDLASDSFEAHDLSSEPSNAAMIRRDQLRIAAWISFQNSYLHHFEPP